MPDKNDRKIEDILKAVKPQPEESFMSDLEQRILAQHREQAAHKEVSFFGNLRRFSMVATPLVVMLLVFTVFFSPVSPKNSGVQGESDDSWKFSRESVEMDAISEPSSGFSAPTTTAPIMAEPSTVETVEEFSYDFSTDAIPLVESEDVYIEEFIESATFEQSATAEVSATAEESVTSDIIDPIN